MKKFSIAFSCSLVIFVILNAAPYFLFSSTEFASMGFPRSFWRFTAGNTHFIWIGFGIDFFIALYASYRIGRWYQRRGECDYLAGERT